MCLNKIIDECLRIWLYFCESSCLVKNGKLLTSNYGCTSVFIDEGTAESDLVF